MDHEAPTTVKDYQHP